MNTSFNIEMTISFNGSYAKHSVENSPVFTIQHCFFTELFSLFAFTYDKNSQKLKSGRLIYLQFFHCQLPFLYADILVVSCKVINRQHSSVH